MNSSALMAPQVNLDEFEQRLRMAGSPVGPQEDPLEELARLVGLDAREQNAADRPFAAPRGAPLRLPNAPLLHVAPARMEESRGQDRSDSEPGMMEEASLRGSFADHAPSGDAAPQEDQPYSEAYLDDAASAEQAAPARRGRRLALTMGVLVTVGAAGGLGAFWVAKGAPGLPKTPPLIMAAAGPTKVQPPTQETISSPSDSASILLKDQTNKPGPVKLVSNQEQPVDLQQAVSLPAPALAPMPASAPIAPAPIVVASTATAAESAPPPAPAAAPAALAAPTSATRSIALTTVGPTAAAPAAPSPFPEPKRVKTVSVRPDGSLISSATEPVADAGASAPVASAAPTGAAAPSETATLPAHPPVPRARPSFDAAASGAAQPTTPKLDLPTKLAPPKSTARVPVAKTDTTVASATAQSPETPLTAVPHLIEKMAKAVTGQQDAPVQVAATDPAPTSATTPTSGAYAVQLAAPGTEREAQSLAARLQAKYAAELGGMQLSIHQADSNGHAIHRVRVSGMSKAEAVALCQKLKTNGGSCFIAKE